mmetsp:Transcript_1377/g.2108  ORF Transcript_1377/g.2108 Transcript_1377/m.2108 type:complete len:373 (-) Transcript_1377:1377-2495(-)
MKSHMCRLQVLSCLILFMTETVVQTCHAFLQTTPGYLYSSNRFQHFKNSPNREILAKSSTTVLHESPVRFAGTGPRQVDMNQYNLPLQTIEEQWTANVIAKTVDDDGGIFLGCENDRENFVDVVTVNIDRPPAGEGLGIGLQEIKGGREDGLGITVVSALVDGGHTDRCKVDINPGDSISSLSIISNSQNTQPQQTRVGLADSEEIISAATECLGYDRTVEAIASLPPPKRNGGESLVLKLKRVRRKPRIKVNLKYPPSEKQLDETIELFAGENLRLGMLTRGVQLNDPLAKRFDTKSEGNCGAGGLCRTCSVSVLRGGDLLSPQKVAEKQMLQDNPRWRLSCKAFCGYGMKEGEITVQVSPNQWYNDDEVA